MNRIILPIDPHVSGRKVAALHDALAALGLHVEASELGSRQFGPTTRGAVMAFQRAQGLDPTGIVDDATALRLNEKVAAVPAVDTAAARGLLGLRGTTRQTPIDALARTIAGNAPGALA